MKRVLSGNEAVARGAWLAGVRFAASYPGTPATEILETLLGDYRETGPQWSINEKVAFDAALGASIGGARSLVAMKHVGLNVAADSLMTASYTGVGGGFVIVSSDDPDMHSSQNEQDNRNYAAFAKIPMLEPADSQESLDFAVQAFELSERFDTPVLLRLTTRISHTRCIVDSADRPAKLPPREFDDRTEKYLMIPQYARVRHRFVEERMTRLASLSASTDLNHAEPGDGPFGLIASGVAYQYAREAFPDAPVFKLGMTWPLPIRRLREFVESVEVAYVIEELDPFLEEHIRAAGIAVRGKSLLPLCGEYSPQLVRNAVLADFTRANEQPEPAPRPVEGLPPRPPAMCPGCVHRGVFYALKRLNVRVMGDIGCYTLGALPPLEMMDAVLCMGASIGLGAGLDKVSEPGRTVAVIGDSTFLHAGIAPLIDMVWNRSAGVVVILDNRVTAMTGRQPTPASAPRGDGVPAESDATPPVDLVALCKAAGVNDVTVVDPYDLDGLIETLKKGLASRAPSVVITNRPCGLIERHVRRPAYTIDRNVCTGCGDCAVLACPAIVAEDGRFRIIENLCSACAICEQVCEAGAVHAPADSVSSEDDHH